MTLEIRKVTQKEFDAYWTPDVCNLLNQHIDNTKWWAVDLDEPRRDKKWVVDAENGITFIGVNVMNGIEHPSQMVGQDVAVVAKDGAVGLVKHRYDKSCNDIYEIFMLTGKFAQTTAKFKSMVLAAVDKGGLGLNGHKGIGSELTENVTFIDKGEAV